MSSTTISPRALYDQMQKGEQVRLIDVRTPAEFREMHVVGASNVPLDQLNEQKLSAMQIDAAKPLYVICRSGSRGKQACDKLAQSKFWHVVNVEGGTLAWDKAGYPVVRGQKAMSLERQVRIAAGLLVLFGSALGFFIHPYLIGIAAFVGAGLVFAGVTDTCGMAMILARMPWNQVKVEPATSPTAGSNAQHQSVCSN